MRCTPRRGGLLTSKAREIISRAMIAKQGCRWLLVGSLRGKLFVLQRGYGGCRAFVAAKQELGNDDPKGEESYENGCGGDCDHYSVSPVGWWAMPFFDVPIMFP